MTVVVSFLNEVHFRSAIVFTLVLSIVNFSLRAGRNTSGASRSHCKWNSFTVRGDLQGPATVAALGTHEWTIRFVDLATIAVIKVQGEVVVSSLILCRAVQVSVIVGGEKEVVA